MVEQGIIDKIHALLNMTEKHGCTEAEANLAMERAQSLLLKHNLTQGDIHLQESKPMVSGIGQVDKTELTGYTWRRDLIAIIANASLCKVVGSPATKTWHIFGTYDNVRGSLEMYHWLTDQLEVRAISDLKTYRQNGGAEHGRTWRTGFFEGACQSLKTRLQKPLEEFAAGEGRAIVVYNSKAVGDAVHRVYPHLSSRASYASHSLDGRSYGRQAGSSISLARQRSLTGRLSLQPG